MVLIVAAITLHASIFAEMQLIGLMTDQVNIDRRGKPPLWPYGLRSRIRNSEILREIVSEYRAKHPNGRLHRRLVASYVGIGLSVAVVVGCVMSFVER